VDFPPPLAGRARVGALRVTISQGSPAHHAFMTTVIGAIMLGLQPIVFLVGGVHAGVLYGGIVGALRS
jgi:hypothetical protein